MMLAGIFLVLIKWSKLGILCEIFGFFNLFGWVQMCIFMHAYGYCIAHTLFAQHVHHLPSLGVLFNNELLTFCFNMLAEICSRFCSDCWSRFLSLGTFYPLLKEILTPNLEKSPNMAQIACMISSLKQCRAYHLSRAIVDMWCLVNTNIEHYSYFWLLHIESSFYRWQIV